MNTDLLVWLAEVRDDPLAFTLGAYPWDAIGNPLTSASLIGGIQP